MQFIGLVFLPHLLRQVRLFCVKRLHNPKRFCILRTSNSKHNTMNQHYYKIDFIGEDGYSVCVSSTTPLLEDEIIDYALKEEVIDKWDVEDFNVNVEEITDDDYEMSFWRDEAIEL